MTSLITELFRPPDLYAGQRLDRQAFYERIERLQQRGENTRGIERLEGVIYMPAAIRMEQHGEPQLAIVTWLGLFAAATPGVQGAGNATSRIDFDNDPEGDAVLRIRPEFGGQSSTDQRGYIVGAPELMVEITGSSAEKDLQLKFEIYRRNGVQEYLVWETTAEEFYWFQLQEGQYYRVLPDRSGQIRSRIFPGLWLDVAALLEGQLARVLQVVQERIASPAHQEFVSQLASRQRAE